MPRIRTSTPPSLRIRDFLALVHEGVVAQLGTKLDGLDVRQRFGYLQYYRGTPEIHYEVWAQKKTSRLEIGLHFEGERDRNYEAAELLAMRAPDVQARIGTEKPGVAARCRSVILDLRLWLIYPRRKRYYC